MTFEDLVSKRMFLLVLVVIAVNLFVSGIGQLGINRTVGWAWDFSNWVFFITLGSSLISIIGYGILALGKVRTHKILSLAHIILITFLMVINSLQVDLRLVWILNLLSLVLLLTNVAWAIKNRRLKAST